MRVMRLGSEHISVLQATLRRDFGTEAVVYLYGSRTDNAARGDDVDLFVETPLTVDYRQRAADSSHCTTHRGAPAMTRTMPGVAVSSMPLPRMRLN
jgi:hypothetical protein